MRYLKCNKVMKKLISMCLILCFIAGMVPVYASDASETVEADKPVLIYINKDFEKQKEGENPYGFLGGANAKVVTMPKADKSQFITLIQRKKHRPYGRCLQILFYFWRGIE